MLYVSEIHSDDDEPETEHEGQPVEQLDPCTCAHRAAARSRPPTHTRTRAPHRSRRLPVHTLTAEDVAASALAAQKASAAAAKERGNAAFGAGKYEAALAAYTEARSALSQSVYSHALGSRVSVLLS